MVQAPSRIRENPAPEWVALVSGIHVRRMIEGNGASIILYRLEPGRRFERHDHPFPELGVILAGRGRALIGDEERSLREGDSFYFPAGTPHGFEVDTSAPVVMMNVTVPLPSELSGPSTSGVLLLAKRFARNPSDSSTRPASEAHLIRST